MKLTKQRQQELLYLAKLVTEERKTEVINFTKEKEITDLVSTLANGSYYEMRFFIKLRYLLDKSFKLTKKERLDLFNMHYEYGTLNYVPTTVDAIEPIANKEKEVENKPHTESALDYFIHTLVVLLIVLLIVIVKPYIF